MGVNRRMTLTDPPFCRYYAPGIGHFLSRDPLETAFAIAPCL
jgi:hypothetical protein